MLCWREQSISQGLELKTTNFAYPYTFVVSRKRYVLVFFLSPSFTSVDNANDF
jgi:hypothetical protein